MDRLCVVFNVRDAATLEKLTPSYVEYFADPPMTPQEAMEEKEEIYSA